MAPPNVPLSATVTSNGKIIKKVEFYNAGALVGSKTNAPYSITWNNVPNGAKTVFARALYGSNSRVDSPPVNFTVGDPTPISGSLSAQGANLLLKWSGAPGLFRVQMITDLGAGGWQDVSVAATNTEFLITPSNRAAFYRVVRP